MRSAGRDRPPLNRGLLPVPRRPQSRPASTRAPPARSAASSSCRPGRRGARSTRSWQPRRRRCASRHTAERALACSAPRCKPRTSGASVCWRPRLFCCPACYTHTHINALFATIALHNDAGARVRRRHLCAGDQRVQPRHGAAQLRGPPRPAPPLDRGARDCRRAVPREVGACGAAIRFVGSLLPAGRNTERALLAACCHVYGVPGVAAGRTLAEAAVSHALRPRAPVLSTSSCRPRVAGSTRRPAGAASGPRRPAPPARSARS